MHHWPVCRCSGNTTFATEHLGKASCHAGCPAHNKQASLANALSVSLRKWATLMGSTPPSYNHIHSIPEATNVTKRHDTIIASWTCKCWSIYCSHCVPIATSLLSVFPFFTNAAARCATCLPPSLRTTVRPGVFVTTRTADDKRRTAVRLSEALCLINASARAVRVNSPQGRLRGRIAGQNSDTNLGQSVWRMLSSVRWRNCGCAVAVLTY